MLRVVRAARRSRPRRHRRAPAIIWRCRPPTARSSSFEHADGVHGAGRGRPRGHRRRGAIRRHGPLRPPADPPRRGSLLVFPALTLNYLGQGALSSTTRRRREPVLPAVPAGRGSRWSSSPPRRVIASQAVISGAFSIDRQAVQLGFLPRLTVRHTSREEIGQVYVPAINWAPRRGARARARLRLVEPRLGLRDRRHRHAGDRHGAILFVVRAQWRRRRGLVVAARSRS